MFGQTIIKEKERTYTKRANLYEIDILSVVLISMNELSTYYVN